MPTLPTTIDEATAQAITATKAVLEDGYTRVQVELVFPEIALQAQSIALQFLAIFEPYGSDFKVLFPDTGAAALARRDWGDIPFKVADIGTSRSPVETRIEPEDKAFLIVSPSAVEVSQVEKLCNLAGDRPCILLNPQMEDLKIVGIGYAARQLRERFLNTIESCYYLQPLNGAVLFRSYPGLWQVWVEIEGDYQLVTEEPQRPVGDTLEQIIATAMGESTEEDIPPTKKPGFLSTLQSFLNALNR